MAEYLYHNGSMLFCFCGIPAVKTYKPGVYLCQKHDKPKVDKVKRPDYSGISKTPYSNKYLED